MLKRFLFSFFKLFRVYERASPEQPSAESIMRKLDEEIENPVRFRVGKVSSHIFLPNTGDEKSTRLQIRKFSYSPDRPSDSDSNTPYKQWTDSFVSYNPFAREVKPEASMSPDIVGFPSLVSLQAFAGGVI